jgi:hypothetical protein
MEVSDVLTASIIKTILVQPCLEGDCLLVWCAV